MRPAEISEGMGLSRTNVHRLLATLTSIGYVVRDAERRFRLSFKVFALGSRVVTSQDLRETAKPVLVELMNETNENTYLNVMHENHVIAIDEVRSRNPLSVKHDMTYSYPLHACASGKVFLSAMEPAVRLAVIERINLQRVSDRTIADPDALLAAVENVAVEGFAREIGEFTDDLNSYAAPVYDYRGCVVATISISGPSIRATQERLESYVPSLVRAAQRVSQALGSKQ